jgi:hypothetical protein
MKGSIVLNYILSFYLLLNAGQIFAQDTIFRLNKAALIGIVKKEDTKSVKISVFKNGKIKEKTVSRKRIVSINRGNTNGYFVFDGNANLDARAFKKKVRANWKTFKIKENKYPDTLALIDRHPKTRMFVGLKKDSIDGDLLYYRKPGRTKVKSMELEKIYSVNYSSSKPKLVLYVQDTIEGNWYSAEQMNDYMRGQNDAYRKYKKKARFSAIAGLLVGIASPAIDDRYGPFVIVGYTGLVGFAKPKLKAKYGFNTDYKDNPYYKEGFGTMAKRLTLWHVATATISGYVIGSAGLLFLVN